MKKMLVIILALALIFTTGIFSLSAYGTTGVEKPLAEEQTQNVITARFENMLNNNHVYADDFLSVSALIEGACISLFKNANEGVLTNVELTAFVKNMYGVDITVIADEEKLPLDILGTTVIPCKGITSYNHSVYKTVTNEDGTLTVYSRVLADSHDSEFAVSYEAISRFAVSENSTFGYNLLSCELLYPEVEVIENALAI